MTTKKPPSRRARASSAPPAVPPEPADRHQLVQLEAYLIAERRGFAPGYELADWLEAERRIADRLSSRA